MKKVISFSLWGSIKLYCIGAVKNAISARKIFPDWVVYIYYDNTVPDIIINYLEKMDNVELKFIEKPSGSKKWMEPGQFGMFWKFYPFDDNDVEIWMARDADSRISYYEKEKIDIFLKSDDVLHGFLFNNKNKKLRGGTTSFKNYSNNKDNRKNLKIKKLIDNFVVNKDNTPFYMDERFLNEIIYPIFSKYYYYDDQIHKLVLQKDIPKNMHISKYAELNNIRYVGEVIDEETELIRDKSSKDWYRYDYSDFDVIIDEFIKRQFK